MPEAQTNLNACFTARSLYAEDFQRGRYPRNSFLQLSVYRVLWTRISSIWGRLCANGPFHINHINATQGADSKEFYEEQLAVLLLQ
jgi:hypothetical protein